MSVKEALAYWIDMTAAAFLCTAMQNTNESHLCHRQNNCDTHGQSTDATAGTRDNKHSLRRPRQLRNPQLSQTCNPRRASPGAMELPQKQAAVSP